MALTLVIMLDIIVDDNIINSMDDLSIRNCAIRGEFCQPVSRPLTVGTLTMGYQCLTNDRLASNFKGYEGYNANYFNSNVRRQIMTVRFLPEVRESKRSECALIELKRHSRKEANSNKMLYIQKMPGIQKIIKMVYFSLFNARRMKRRWSCIKPLCIQCLYIRLPVTVL